MGNSLGDKIFVLLVAAMLSQAGVYSVRPPCVMDSTLTIADTKSCCESDFDEAAKGCPCCAGGGCDKDLEKDANDLALHGKNSSKLTYSLAAERTTLTPPMTIYTHPNVSIIEVAQPPPKTFLLNSSFLC